MFVGDLAFFLIRMSPTRPVCHFFISYAEYLFCDMNHFNLADASTGLKLRE